ncbi:MAG: class I SAM-dependent methyltransferase [Xanthobacteraceae bacterium]
MPLTATLATPVTSEPNFRKYSAVYDLLYRDKDYAAEADYVARMVRESAPKARALLELGSGTGRHGRCLAGAGFQVHGIERSADMVALAELAPAAGLGFTCQVGDVRSVMLDRSFDAVIALFHVVSYQVTDDDLRAIFATAARHLHPGGVFLFDVWHGPAVLAQPPEQRVKKVEDDNLEVIRTARPELNTNNRTVKVTYDMECRDRHTGEIARFSEDHLMRCLFVDEIESFAAQSGMHTLASEEFMTGAAPSPATWGVLYLLRKAGAS